MEGKPKPSGVFTGRLIDTLERFRYTEFIPSVLCETELFIKKAGPAIVNQMYAFKDKGDRDLCLIPEVTAVAQWAFENVWCKNLPKPVRSYYLTRCYRYERPQRGRYREFWQFGVEYQDTNEESLFWGGDEVKQLLRACLDACGLVDYRWNDRVKRGLGYYIEDGFEVEVDSLGAQRQVAGGGRYRNGVGWAIGVERLMAACGDQEKGI